MLQRLLDEVKYEQKHDPAAAQPDEDISGDDDGDRGQGGQAAREVMVDKPLTPSTTKSPPSTDLDPSLSLPSAPTTLPSSPATTDANDSDLAARFALLALPSAPPGSAPKTQIKPKSSQQYSDDEIDSWCIICSDDATLQCAGCDGDLYCTNCWLEGHRGEDAGLEERRHKATQFVKGKKKKQKEGRRLVGAQ